MKHILDRVSDSNYLCEMPLRCMEFSGYIGALASFFVLSALLWILSFIMTPLGPIGRFIVNVLRLGLGIWMTYSLLNMLATVFGLRGDCSQGFVSVWPSLVPKYYNRDSHGFKHEEPSRSLF